MIQSLHWTSTCRVPEITHSDLGILPSAFTYRVQLSGCASFHSHIPEASMSPSSKENNVTREIMVYLLNRIFTAYRTSPASFAPTWQT
jgi:hypothetical protein